MATEKKKKKSKYDLDGQKGVKVTTPPGILSFPKLFKAEKFEGKGDAFYSTAILFDEDADIKPIRQAIFKAKKAVFGPDKDKWPKVSSPLRSGDEKEDQPDYAGKTFFSTKTKTRPLVIDRSKERIEDEAEIYGGVVAQLVVVAKVTSIPDRDAKDGFRYFVSLYLQGVRKVEDGTPLGGGASADDFEDLEDEENGDDDNDESEENDDE